MSAPPAEQLMTEAEYLAFESRAETKHEFVDGYVYDWPGYEVGPSGLAGATRTHNRLQLNVLMALGTAARARGCEAFGRDMRLRVRIEQRGRRTTRYYYYYYYYYYYADATVLCDREVRPELGDDDMHITRSCVIVEVLSRGSERIDRGEKLAVYQGLPSLQSYLVVHQQQQRIERHWRREDGSWDAETMTSGVVPLACIDFDLPLEAAYDDVGMAQRSPR
jgi:Uma2 family endonuclease